MSKRKYTPTTVGINCKRLRKVNAWTQVRLGRRTGWGQQRIAAIETGAEVHQQTNTLETLAKALGCSVADLVEENGDG